VAAVAALLALHQWGLPWIGVAALALLAASIFCHVAGNCLGTRLRDIGDQAVDGGDQVLGKPRGTKPEYSVPATRLGERSSLGWTIVVATVAGVVAGGVGGILWTVFASRGPVGSINLVIGAIAFATLGGIGAFSTVAFVQVLSGAIWQAMKGSPANVSSSKFQVSSSEEPT
jgi:hypothetical protein